MADKPGFVGAPAPDPSVDNSLEAQMARHFAELDQELVFPLPGDTEPDRPQEPPVSAEGTSGESS
jgi:hypothetical protein